MGRFGMDELERSIGDLVIANRILAKEEVVDAYGHVSIRHPSKPDHYLLSRSLSPEFVTPADIIEFKLDGTPTSDTRPAYLERYIHGAVYEARPDVNAVIHSHAEAVLPFSISKTPMCCVAHVASDMGTHVPVWDIDEKFGDATNLLVINMDQGRDMAKKLGKNSVVLMRGHGFAAAADGLLKLVRLSVYLPRNARILMAAIQMGEFKAMSENEIKTRNNFRAGSPEMQRGWEFWAKRAGCGDMLKSSRGGV
jgi:ribulose-5-phosphate 4-epimerase/fuculose-1-phosphate aldolase